MSPIPCHHCGYNFMRSSMNPEEPRLCNNCSVRENLRSPNQGIKMEESTIDILIKCPTHIHKQIEEDCLSNGKSYSQYFLDLHYLNSIAYTRVEEKCSSDDIPSQETKKGRKK